jgi:hypothetical protein
MFRHIALFQWNEEATDERKRAALDGLAALPGQIPEVRSFRFGADAGLSNGNFDVAVVADFDDAEAYRRYAEHPAHVALLTDLIRPIITARAAVQHHMEGA